jgi:hypothetical protein
MASSPDSGDDAMATEEETVEELMMARMMARLLPTTQQMFSQSAEHASSNASPAIATAPPATLAAPAATAISLDVSDPEVGLDSLRRELSAADTFHLDHLDDDELFPVYDSTLEPGHIPSAAAGNHEEPDSSPRTAPSPSVVTSAYSAWNVTFATPARPWGPLRPPTRLPRRTPASAPMLMPGAPPPAIPFNPLPSFEPSANTVHFRNGTSTKVHGMGFPFHPLPTDAACASMLSPSSRPLLVDGDSDWLDQDFFPALYRLDDVQSRVPPSQVPQYSIPGCPAAFGPPRVIVWPDPGVPQLQATVRLSTGASVSCQYDAYVEGFPHPYSRGSFHPQDKAKQQSGSKFYIVFYGHEVGIFKSWGGCWVRTCDYPGARFMAVNHYKTALFLLWVSDAYRNTEVHRRNCPRDGTLRLAYHRWPRYPHPMEVEMRTIPDGTLAPRLAAPRLLTPTTCPPAARFQEDDDAEIRPIPMVNVTQLDNDDDLSSYMEVSHFGAPALPDDGFLPALHRGSSVCSSQTTITQDTIALQQAVIEANRDALELEGKFDKLDKAENFDWWHRQIRNRLKHSAWKSILGQGEPYVTTAANSNLSSKLGQRLNQCMTATIGDAIGGIDEYDGRGMEMLQAIIDHFIPSAAVNLPTIFTAWNQLHQNNDELAAVFSSRVSRLANRSKRAGQAYTEVSQILNFVNGLHDGLDDFAKDYFSGWICLASTSLQNTTTLAKTLELTMPARKANTPRSSGSNRRSGRARRASGTPDNESVDVSSGPLSRAQVDALFSNFSCPLHRVNNHTCMECYAFSDHGFLITKKPAGAGRRVTGPYSISGPSSSSSSSSSACDDSPTDAPADDNDVSVASSVADFGVDYVLGSGKRVGKVAHQQPCISKPFMPYR